MNTYNSVSHAKSEYRETNTIKWVWVFKDFEILLPSIYRYARGSPIWSYAKSLLNPIPYYLSKLSFFSFIYWLGVTLNSSRKVLLK